MATSTNFVSSLGAGSGIDIKTLAQSLVDAEKTPRKDRIEAKIKQSETKVSGYGALKYALSQLKTSFEALNDARDFSSLIVSNSQSSALNIATSNSAKVGSLSVEISQIAKPQRQSSLTFSSKTAALGVAVPFDLSFQDANGSQTLTVITATPDGIAQAINASSSQTGLNAQWLKTGQGFQLVVTGKTGASNHFTLSAGPMEPVSVNSSVQLNQTGEFISASASAAEVVTLNYDNNGQSGSINLVQNTQGLWELPSGQTLPAGASQFSTNATRSVFASLQSAQDAKFSINGIEITSDTNEVTDVIEGVNLSLYTPTQGAAKVDISRQSSTIRDNLNALVQSFNEFQDSVKVLQDPSSKVETFGGALEGDSLTRRIQSQIRELFTQDAKPAGQYIKAARDIGLNLDRFGKLSLDEGKLNKALTDHFDEVVMMFTANKNDKSVYSKSEAGLAGNAVRSLDQLLRSTSMIDQQTASETKKIDSYKADLEKLQAQMDRLLERYMNQFTIMDNIVGNSNSTRESLKNSLQQLSNSNDS